jgi:hypothetical protein
MLCDFYCIFRDILDYTDTTALIGHISVTWSCCTSTAMKYLLQAILTKSRMNNTVPMFWWNKIQGLMPQSLQMHDIQVNEAWRSGAIRSIFIQHQVLRIKTCTVNVKTKKFVHTISSIFFGGFSNCRLQKMNYITTLDDIVLWSCPALHECMALHTKAIQDNQAFIMCLRVQTHCYMCCQCMSIAVSTSTKHSHA